MTTVAAPRVRPAALVLHYGLLAAALGARASALAAAGNGGAGFALHHVFGVAAILLIAASWWEQWIALRKDNFTLQDTDAAEWLGSGLLALGRITLGRGDARTQWHRLMPLLIAAGLVVATLVVVLGLLGVAPVDAPQPPPLWVIDVRHAHLLGAASLMLLLIVDLWALLCRWVQGQRRSPPQASGSTSATTRTPDSIN